MRVIVKPTGVWLLPPRLARWLGIWSAWPQRDCPHPEHRRRRPYGDERMHYPDVVWRCLECGLVARTKQSNGLLLELAILWCVGFLVAVAVVVVVP